MHEILFKYVHVYNVSVDDFAAQVKYVHVP